MSDYIERSTRREHWAVIDHLTADDITISFEAGGMLMYLLDKPDKWKVKLKQLERRYGGKVLAGRDKVRRIINELSEAGYITKPIRYQQKDGRFRWTNYIVHERPLTANPVMDEGPWTAYPYTANPSSYLVLMHLVLKSLQKVTQSEDVRIESMSIVDEPQKDRVDVVKLWVANMGLLPKSGKALKILEEMGDRHSEVIVLEAMQRTGERNPDNPFAYFRKVVEDVSEAHRRARAHGVDLVAESPVFESQDVDGEEDIWF